MTAISFWSLFCVNNESDENEFSSRKILYLRNK